MGAADRLFVKYSHMQMLGQTAGTLPPGPNPAVNVGQYLTGGGVTTLANWAAAINYTKVVNANIVNEVRLGVIRPAWGDTLANGSTRPDRAAARTSRHQYQRPD